MSLFPQGPHNISGTRIVFVFFNILSTGAYENVSVNSWCQMNAQPRFIYPWSRVYECSDRAVETLVEDVIFAPAWIYPVIFNTRHSAYGISEQTCCIYQDLSLEPV